MLKIGIDIGGTNTDGVLIEKNNVLAKVKLPTRDKIAESIFEVIKQLLVISNKKASQINFLMLGTTHFLNAFLQKKHLSKVSVVRLGLPTASFLPAFVDWPEQAKSAIFAGYDFLHGGYHIDGSEISALNEKEIIAAAKKIQTSEAQAVAISMPYSYVNNDMELIVKSIIQDFNPSLPITCSHQFAKSGLFERENSAIINASLMHYAKEILASIQTKLLSMLPNMQIYISGNDGTLMNFSHIITEPVRTFASGPTNSMRGAFVLTGIEEAVVADVGGTSTDIGVLIKGFPRKRSLYSELCGVRSAFSIPDVLSLAIGGGSLVKSDEPFNVGPVSVASRLATQSKCFGGNVLTLTDVFFAHGLVDLPGADDSNILISPNSIKKLIAFTQARFVETVDKIKSSKKAIPLIAIGGGAYMIQKKMAGISEVIRPQHYEVANAVGAASGEISGEATAVLDYDKVNRQDALSRIKALAFQQAVKKGADTDSLEIIEMHEVPTPYLPGKINRVYFKAVGKLKYDKT